MSNHFVFNQYYIDLLKRLKSVSKKIKDGDQKENIDIGKTVYKSIKENYITLDKSSDEYVKYVNDTVTDDFWTSYLEIEDINNADDWFSREDILNTQIFEKISLKNIKILLNDEFLCHHFLSVLYIFKHEISEEDTKTIVLFLQGNDKNITIDNVTDVNYKKLLQRLNDMKIKRIKDKSGIDMKSIEDTTLGKLAKEILEDVDVDKIQKSIGEKGDVLKAIGDPDSGFTELITNVSRKMANKISSGELKQETLLQDAMKFASVMPGLFGGASGANSSDKNHGVPDMSAMMNMMGSMMGNKDNMNMFKQMAENMKGPKGSKTSFNNSSYKKMAAAKKLKAKLNKRREGGEEN